MKEKIFIDAGPFIALHNKRDPLHESARRDFELLTKECNICHTSDFILDEVIAFVIKKTENPDIVLSIDEMIQESTFINMFRVDDSAFTDAKEYMKKYPRLLLSLTDWTTVVILRDNSIKTIFSYDSDFDRIKGIKEFKNIQRVKTFSQNP